MVCRSLVIQISFQFSLRPKQISTSKDHTLLKDKSYIDEMISIDKFDTFNCNSSEIIQNILIFLSTFYSYN